MTATTEKTPALTTCIKSTCERYDLRHRPEGSRCNEWGIFFVSEAGGVLSILSDYGNWSYAWPHHGRTSFKHFLVELGRDTDYLIGKLSGAKTVFNADKSKQLIFEIIRERRRDGALTKEKAREAYDELESVAADCSGSEDLFLERLMTTIPWLYEYCCDGLTVREHDSGIVSFVKRVWPLFVAEIQKELAR
jgi:hypothetical protein